MKKQKHLTTREKTRITIQELADRGYNGTEISRMGYNKNTVYKWMNRDSYQNKKGQGRKKKMTPEIEAKIEELMKGKIGIGTRKCAKILQMQKQEGEWMPKRGAILCYVKSTDWGKKSFALKVKPLLTEKNINDRNQFCQTVDAGGYCDPGRRGVEKRSHVLWTDESMILLNPIPNRQRMRIRVSDKSEIPVIQVPKHSEKIHVAGGICSRGKTELIIIPKGQTINAKFYQENILPVYFEFMKDTNFFPKQDLVTFMSDGAPCHTAKSTMKLIEEKMSDPVVNVWTGRGVWPGSSPDLNVIEPVWGELQESVFLEPRPKTRQELEERLKVSWDTIDIDYLSRLVESFPERIKECKTAGGRHTSY